MKRELRNQKYTETAGRRNRHKPYILSRSLFVWLP